jgi:hypothetical protein
MLNFAKFTFESNTQFLQIEVEDKIFKFDLSHTIYDPNCIANEPDYSFKIISSENHYIIIQVTGDSITIIDTSI